MHIHALSQVQSGIYASTHRLKTFNTTPDQRTVEVSISSHTNAENTFAVWNEIYLMPFEEFSNSPAPLCVYNWLISDTGPFPGGALIHDPTSLDSLKVIKSKRVHELREAVFVGGCETPAGVVDTTESSIVNIMAAYQTAVLSIVMQQPWQMVWRLKDNTEVTLDASGMIGLGNAVMRHKERAMRHSWALKEQIKHAQTLDELNAVNIDIGWFTDMEAPEAA